MSWRPLCTRCVCELGMRATVVEASDPGAGSDPFRFDGGPDALDRAQMHEWQGRVLTINNLRGAGVRADVLFDGESLCTAHLPQAVTDRRARPRGRW